MYLVNVSDLYLQVHELFIGKWQYDKRNSRPPVPSMACQQQSLRETVREKKAALISLVVKTAYLNT